MKQFIILVLLLAACQPLQEFSASDLIEGGPPKDGIPSIDDPVFISVSEADEWIGDDALVLTLEYKGIHRAYPLQIMTWHEIVNDVVAGDPVLITYCPLCGSGVAFLRTLDGEAVEFGTSGKLYNSNLVMYDRKTDSYWTQIDGTAILGERAGEQLQEIDSDVSAWGEWRQAHPDGEVLGTDTGFTRDYLSEQGPYANYFADDFSLFPGIKNLDAERKLPNKEYVLGIERNGRFKAYPKLLVEEKGYVEDTGMGLVLEKKQDGTIDITDKETGELIPKEVMFWFAWFALHPETELYGFNAT